MSERPVLPEVDFDWELSEWAQAGSRVLELVGEVSTGWSDRRPGPVESPGEILSQFDEPLPRQGAPFDHLVEHLREVAGMSTYIGHPRWFAYITSSANPVGVMADFMTAALNPNIGLWRGGPAATAVELQSLGWIKEMLGYPSESEGVYTSGGQFANILAHAVIRNHRAGWDVRTEGMARADAPRLRVYASAELHHCHREAVELLGMGQEALRLVPVDDDYRVRVDMLVRMIEEDRRLGHRPVAIVATAGTVGTGAVDPIPELVKVGRSEDLWLHVDGAYGAFAAIAPSAPDSLRAIGDADSIACDPHKWLYAPIDAGVVLIRHPGLLAETFSLRAAYLRAQDAGDERVDFAELGPENSRRARGMKVWMALQAYGLDGYRDMIERNLLLASYMERLVRETPNLVPAAPRELSIVCWRVEPPGVPEDRLNELQIAVLDELDRRGIAIISNATTQDGRVALRACIVNFRTAPEDVEAVVSASADLGQELSS